MGTIWSIVEHAPLIADKPKKIGNEVFIGKKLEFIAAKIPKAANCACLFQMSKEKKTAKKSKKNLKFIITAIENMV